ncbi:MAG: pyridoxal phosphate-dependent aminotransferase [Planctomycetota bacterium]
MTGSWIAQRTRTFDSSGIRKVFDLAGSMESPIDLSIGQPDYDVPAPVRAACIDAIESGKNNYALTQGIPVLREKLKTRIDQQYGHADRDLFVCSGTSGGLVLALLSMVNPGDEVIVFDPYFVMYESLTRLVGGIPVLISTYPDFQIPLDRVAAAITDKTKLIVLNSPANPTGTMATPDLIQGLAELARRHDVALISDEIYSEFCYDHPFVSPAEYNERTIVIDGFSKNYAMTGWRLGFVHGPHELIDTMIKVQQYTFVCAPHPVQWAGAAAMDLDIQQHIQAYHEKRDMLVDGLSDLYEIANPNGAFYVFPKAPWGTGTEFVTKAIEHNLLIIPGHVFSREDTHFRISYAASDEVIEQGIEVLRNLAQR